MCSSDLKVGVDGDPNVLSATFGNTPYSSATQSYPLVYTPPGTTGFATRTGAIAQNTLGGNFYGDTTYRISITVPHEESSVAVDFSALNLENLNNESWGLDNVRVWTSDSEGVPNLTVPGNSVTAPAQIGVGNQEIGRAHV